MVPAQAEARAALADEWHSLNPQTADEIAQFYSDSRYLAGDLEAWHATPGRQQYTALLVQLARQAQAKVVVDIGCGGGHDLLALYRAGVQELYGVEPNAALRARCPFPVQADVADVPIECADLLVCVDVLEHVLEPELFLARTTDRARIGAVFFESTSTDDHDTPLHLDANHGWKPNRYLEQTGWQMIQDLDRVHVWQRYAQKGVSRASYIVCAYRSISLPTHKCLTKLLTTPSTNQWREQVGGEAGINRARSVQASKWYRETADDVFLMIDDDITFDPQDANTIVERCRQGYDVIAAAYPTGDASHLAVRTLGEKALRFGPDVEPMEMRHVATGFFAVHRRVIEAMTKTLPYCNSDASWAFWPLFGFGWEPDPEAGGFNNLSEDYFFCNNARALGFKVYLDMSIMVGHEVLARLNVVNMQEVYRALRYTEPVPV